MTETTRTTVSNNVRLLKAMNEVVVLMNDERAYESWIITVPDGADDDDFEDIAMRDDEMDDVCRLFRSIVGRYGRAGWFTKYHSVDEIGKEPLCEYGADEDYEEE